MKKVQNLLRERVLPDQAELFVRLCPSTCDCKQ